MTTGPLAVRSASLTGLPSGPFSVKSGALSPTWSPLAGVTSTAVASSATTMASNPLPRVFMPVSFLDGCDPASSPSNNGREHPGTISGFSRAGREWIDVMRALRPAGIGTLGDVREQDPVIGRIGRRSLLGLGLHRAAATGGEPLPHVRVGPGVLDLTHLGPRRA